jgi:hypothetical protein
MFNELESLILILFDDPEPPQRKDILSIIVELPFFSND